MGQLREALKEAEELLSLSPKDPLEVRAHLLALYVFFEEGKKAEALYRRLGDDSTEMLLAMTFLYYKESRYTKARGFLKKLNANNWEFLAVVADLEMGGTGEEDLELDGYFYDEAKRLEAQEAFMVMPPLYNSSESFNKWILEELVEMD